MAFANSISIQRHKTPLTNTMSGSFFHSKLKRRLISVGLTVYAVFNRIDDLYAKTM